MAWFNEDNPNTLNFMVIGHHNSGYGLVQTALNAHSKIICHGDLLHDNVDIRKYEHERYFGDSGKVPDWFIATHLSVEQYLNNKIFDNALEGEAAIGLKVNYRHFMQYDLWDYTNQKYRRGDFCLIHVTRNPVACFLSYKRNLKPNATIFVDPIELTEFVRFQEAMTKKINELSRDRVVIPYHEFVLNHARVMATLFSYLELPYEEHVPEVDYKFKKNALAFIGNIGELKQVLPNDVQVYLSELLIAQTF